MGSYLGLGGGGIFLPTGSRGLGTEVSLPLAVGVSNHLPSFKKIIEYWKWLDFTECISCSRKLLTSYFEFCYGGS